MDILCSLFHPQLTDNLELQMEPTALLGVRQRVHGGHLVPEVLIRWVHLPDHKAT